MKLKCGSWKVIENNKLTENKKAKRSDLHAAGLQGRRFFFLIKMEEENLHSTDSSVSGEECVRN